MNEFQNKHLTANAQALRRDMTKEERHLWYDFLKQLPVNVRRQKVFGNYIADFYIAQAKLVIELDGSQHYEDEGRTADRERDAYFAQKGLRVLRYANSDVNYHFQAVCEDILHHLQQEQTPHQSPSVTASPQGEAQANESLRPWPLEKYY